MNEPTSLTIYIKNYKLHLYNLALTLEINIYSDRTWAGLVLIIGARVVIFDRVVKVNNVHCSRLQLRGFVLLPKRETHKDSRSNLSHNSYLVSGYCLV